MEDKPIYRPRLVVDISEEQRIKLDRYLEYGMRSRIFSVIIDDVILMIEKHGANFLAAILAKHLRLEDYSSIMKESHGKPRKSTTKGYKSTE